MKALSLNFKDFYHSIWERIIASSELTDTTLRACRLLLPGLYLLIYLPSYNWIANMPDAWYDPAPLSSAMFFSSFPDLWILQITQTLLVLCLALLMAGVKPRLTGLLFCGLHLFITSFEYSAGKIDHVAHLFLLCFFSFSLGNWGSSIPTKFRLPIPCGTLLALLLTFGMFTAGFEKAIRWIDFNSNTSGFLSWYFSGYYNLGRDQLLAPFVTEIPKLGLEFMDYSAVALELSPLACLLLGRRYWITWCAIACSFHAGTTLLLNISFPYQFFGYLPFIIPGYLAARIRIPAAHIVYLALALSTYRIATIWISEIPLLREALLPTDLATLSFDLCVWIGLASIGLLKALQLVKSGQLTSFDFKGHENRSLS
ncbi:MAG: hypothetical protein ACPGJU_08030 [Coraliomargarita sp.]